MQPAAGFKTFQTEEQIGFMFPFNVVVQEASEGGCSVAALNPFIAMKAVRNPALEAAAREVTDRIRRAVLILDES